MARQEKTSSLSLILNERTAWDDELRNAMADGLISHLQSDPSVSMTSVPCGQVILTSVRNIVNIINDF